MIRSILGATSAAALGLGTVPATAADTPLDSHQIKHVLLISIDGLHALDLSNFIATHADSALAELSRHGVTYSNNSTSSPSDSFPGLATLVTGGSPVTTGLWYDDTYNRALSPPAQTDGLGDRVARGISLARALRGEERGEQSAGGTHDHQSPRT